MTATAKVEREHGKAAAGARLLQVIPLRHAEDTKVEEQVIVKVGEDEEGSGAVVVVVAMIEVVAVVAVVDEAATKARLPMEAQTQGLRNPSLVRRNQQRWLLRVEKLSDVSLNSAISNLRQGSETWKRSCLVSFSSDWADCALWMEGVIGCPNGNVSWS